MDWLDLLGDLGDADGGARRRGHGDTSWGSWLVALAVVALLVVGLLVLG